MLAGVTGFIATQSFVWASHISSLHLRGPQNVVTYARVCGGCEAFVALLLLLGGILLLNHKTTAWVLLNVLSVVGLIVGLELFLDFFVPPAVYSWEPSVLLAVLRTNARGRDAGLAEGIVALALLIFANLRSTRHWVGAITPKPGPAYGQPPYPQR
jgi:hypothetical protein